MPDWYRLKWYGVLAIGAGFMAAGTFLAVTRDPGGWLVVVFFGLVAAMAVHELWPEAIQGSSIPPDTVLARFPGPAKLTTPRRKQIFILIGIAVFAGCLLVMALYWPFSALERFLLWLGAIGCAAALPFLLLPLIRGSVLRLDADGFEVFQGLKRSGFQWRDTSDFVVADVGAPMVFFNSTAIDAGTIAALNQRMTGFSGALPDTYGMDAWTLAALLNAWRERALSIPPPPTQSHPAP